MEEKRIVESYIETMKQNIKVYLVNEEVKETWMYIKSLDLFFN